MLDAREGHSGTHLQSEETPAGIHARRAVVGYGVETEVAFPKPRLRTESTSNRPSNRLAELSRLAGCLRLHSTSKCAKWLMLRAEKRFLSRGPLQAPVGRVEGTQANQIPVSDLPGGPCGLRAFGTKTRPLLIRCAVFRVVDDARKFHAVVHAVEVLISPPGSGAPSHRWSGCGAGHATPMAARNFLND